MGALVKNLSDQHNSHTLVGCLLTPPGEEPDEAPKLENANQRFAFSLISDQRSSYLVKKLSDRLNSRCSLMKPLIRPLVKNLINPLSSATQIKDLLLHL